jgi:LPXTG-motif cell wall-anchored protein
VRSRSGFSDKEDGMRIPRTFLMVWASCALALLAGVAGAQETKKSTETRNFEIISVDGNKVVYKSEAGVKEVTLPADFKLDMDGKQVGVADLKPGMKGTAVITTTTTVQPVTVTEVRNAKVLAVAGNAIIVRGQNGVRKFTLDDVADKNIKIVREGQSVDLSGLRVGDNLTATIITRHPPKVMTDQEVRASVSAPPAEPAPAPVAASAPAPAPEHRVAAVPAAAPAKEHLPKTGSNTPMLGLLGGLSLAAGAALSLRRLRRGR